MMPAPRLLVAMTIVLASCAPDWSDDVGRSSVSQLCEVVQLVLVDDDISTRWTMVEMISQGDESAALDAAIVYAIYAPREAALDQLGRYEPGIEAVARRGRAAAERGFDADPHGASADEISSAEAADATIAQGGCRSS